ncbi:MAG: hypothetical protein ACKPKO_43850 [Candidatus Fonsibacter sp.]
MDGVTKTVFELKKFDFVMSQQEISSIALWNPVASIIFCLISPAYSINGEVVAKGRWK